MQLIILIDLIIFHSILQNFSEISHLLNSFSELNGTVDLGQKNLAQLIVEEEITEASGASHAFERRYSPLQLIITYDFSLPKAKKAKKPKKPSILEWFGFNPKEKGVEPKEEAPFESVDPAFIEYGDAFEIRDHYVMKKTFQYFGYLIKNVKLIYNENSTKSNAKFVAELINKYSSLSLEEVHSENFHKCLQFISKPLKNVKTVTFEDICHHGGSKTLRMDELFPAVERLHLDCYVTHNFEIDFPLIHLKHLRYAPFFSEIESENEVALEAFIEILESNSQIDSVELDTDLELDISQRNSYIEHLIMFSPDLETLTLWDFAVDQQFIFENVQTFYAKSKYATAQYLQFPNLRDLYITKSKKYFLTWLIFFRNHNNLASINFL